MAIWTRKQCYKTFFVTNDNANKLQRLSLARPYWVGSLTFPHQKRLERLARLKHSSLIGLIVGENEKKVLIKLTPGTEILCRLANAGQVRS